MAEITYSLNPYLTVGDAAKAIDFYQKAFDAKELTRMPFEDGKRLMHAEMTFNGSVLMLADEFPEMCGNDAAVRAPTVESPAGVAIVLHYTDPGQVDQIYDRALKAGCTSIMAPDNMFWGARFAGVRCPFGHRWMLNAPLPQNG